MTTPTTDELRAMYHRAGLWRTGWSFDRSMANSMIRRCLISAAKKVRRDAEAAGKVIPTQHSLI